MRVKVFRHRAESRKTFLWRITFPLREVKPGATGEETFCTHHKTIEGAFKNFGVFLRLAYRKNIISFFLPLRLPVGVAVFRLCLMGGGV